MGKPTRYQMIQYNTDIDDQAVAAVGGITIRLTNSATAALNIGDAVYLSADFTVSKVAASSNTHRAGCIGVVVGGKQTDFMYPEGLTAAQVQSGILAANQSEDVLVMVRGICYVISDAAIAGYGPIKLGSTTAGRVLAASQLSVLTGATAVTSSAANGAIITGEYFSGVLGKNLQIASGAGQAILAYIDIR